MPTASATTTKFLYRAFLDPWYSENMQVYTFAPKYNLEPCPTQVIDTEENWTDIPKECAIEVASDSEDLVKSGIIQLKPMPTEAEIKKFRNDREQKYQSEQASTNEASANALALQNLATKGDLQTIVTKADLEAVKADLQSVKEQLTELQDLTQLIKDSI